jgi:hypothetical protein
MTRRWIREDHGLRVRLRSGHRALIRAVKRENSPGSVLTYRPRGLWNFQDVYKIEKSVP